MYKTVPYYLNLKPFASKCSIYNIRSPDQCCGSGPFGVDPDLDLTSQNVLIWIQNENILDMTKKL